jgi:anti-sigma factor RsiW
MCPDRQILSLYVDCELPSPWKEKLETHLDSCGDCRKKIDKYKTLRSVLKSGGDEALMGAKDRVWARMASAAALRGLKAESSPPGDRKIRLWKRRISIPLPAAAAAAVVFVATAVIFAATAIFVLAGIGSPAAGTAQSELLASSPREDVPGMAAFSDMDGVMQYLSSQDMGNYMLIKLPETRSFSSTGEPTLLRAADFRGASPVADPSRGSVITQ